MWPRVTASYIVDLQNGHISGYCSRVLTRSYKNRAKSVSATKHEFEETMGVSSSNGYQPSINLFVNILKVGHKYCLWIQDIVLQYKKSFKAEKFMYDEKMQQKNYRILKPLIFSGSLTKMGAECLFFIVQ